VKFLGRSWQNFAKNLFYKGRYDLPEMLFYRPVKFPTAATRKSLTGWSRLMVHRKAERVAFQNSIWNLISANPRLEIEDLFCRCSIQDQNSAAMLTVKLP
jgi:hypothetical protein